MTKDMEIGSYFSHPRQSSGNHAPKCLPFSILCAKSVIIHTSITYNMIKTGVGVNCNGVYAPTAKNLFFFLLAILTLESAGSIRFLYKHFLSKISDKSLNTFYYVCS